MYVLPSRFVVSLVANLFAVAASAWGQAITINGATTYTQDFSSLGLISRPWRDGDLSQPTLPGWYAGINANSTVDGDLVLSDGTNGSLSGLLNLGATGSPDRALGSKTTLLAVNGSTHGNIAFGVLFRNTSLFPLEVTSLSYTGELWRRNSGGIAERWDTYTKTSPFLFKDVEPGNNSASPNAGTFTPAPAYHWAVAGSGSPGAATDGNTAGNRLTLAGQPNITIAPGSYFMFRWVDTNLAGTDGHQAIDDFSITFTVNGTPSHGPLTYNLSHNVSGSPNGVLAVSPDAYWLDNGTPSGFTNRDTVRFSQSGTATIVVPAAVRLTELSVTNASGLYTLQTDADVTVDDYQGASPLRKSGPGSLILARWTAPQGAIDITGGTVTFTNSLDANYTGLLTGSGGVTIAGFTRTGLGAGINDTQANTFTGQTRIASGTLIAQKADGVQAIGGDLVIEAGGTFLYQFSRANEQIPNTATITINGGTFGDPLATATPFTDASETVANVVINSGTFASGRTSAGAFTITGRLAAVGGNVLIQRGGVLAGQTVEIGAGLVSLDGSSSTQQSRLLVGSGGITINGGRINFNTGSNLVQGLSLGSALVLGGDLHSTGNSVFIHQNANLPAPPPSPATIDLGGSLRTFDVIGNLTVGTSAAPIPVRNGSLTKSGAGRLSLFGEQPLQGDVIVEEGTLEIVGSLIANALEVRDGAKLMGAGNIVAPTEVTDGGTIDLGNNLLSFSRLTLGVDPDDVTTVQFRLQPSFAALQILEPNGLFTIGEVVLDLGGAQTTTQRVLIDYQGAIGGDGFDAFSVRGVAPGWQAFIVNNLASTSVELVVIPVPEPASLVLVAAGFLPAFLARRQRAVR